MIHPAPIPEPGYQSIYLGAPAPFQWTEANYRGGSYGGASGLPISPLAEFVELGFAVDSHDPWDVDEDGYAWPYSVIFAGGKTYRVDWPRFTSAYVDALCDQLIAEDYEVPAITTDPTTDSFRYFTSICRGTKTWTDPEPMAHVINVLRNGWLAPISWDLVLATYTYTAIDLGDGFVGLGVPPSVSTLTHTVEMFGNSTSETGLSCPADSPITSFSVGDTVLKHIVWLKGFTLPGCS
jgi:hypothetical protein